MTRSLNGERKESWIASGESEKKAGPDKLERSVEEVGGGLSIATRPRALRGDRCDHYGRLLLPQSSSRFGRILTFERASGALAG